MRQGEKTELRELVTAVAIGAIMVVALVSAAVVTVTVFRLIG
jgi:hypothetical protein